MAKRQKTSGRQAGGKVTVRGKNLHITVPTKSLKDLDVKGRAGSVKGGIIAILIQK